MFSSFVFSNSVSTGPLKAEDDQLSLPQETCVGSSLGHVALVLYRKVSLCMFFGNTQSLIRVYEKKKRFSRFL